MIRFFKIVQAVLYCVVVLKAILRLVHYII
jgi:hypothetical protein